jgi:hypothetical protein
MDPDLAAGVICGAVDKSRHVRSRSNSRARLQAARAVECGGGGNDRQRAAAGSPARPQSRVSGHGLRRALRLCEAREVAKRSRAAVEVETRRRECSARRRGSARVAKSGEVLRATGCTGTKTSDVGGSLTSLRVSRRAPWRRGSVDGGKPKAAAET